MLSPRLGGHISTPIVTSYGAHALSETEEDGVGNASSDAVGVNTNVVGDTEIERAPAVDDAGNVIPAGGEEAAAADAVAEGRKIDRETVAETVTEDGGDVPVDRVPDAAGVSAALTSTEGLGDPACGDVAAEEEVVGVYSEDGVAEAVSEEDAEEGGDELARAEGVSVAEALGDSDTDWA